MASCFHKHAWKTKVLSDWHDKVMNDHSLSMCIADVQSVTLLKWIIR